MKRYRSVIDKTLDYTVSFILLSLSVIVALNVFCRFVLSFSLTWGDETAQILLVWLTFLGAALAMRNESHYAFDYLVKALPEKAGKIVGILTRLIVIFTLFLLLYWSSEVTAGISNWTMPATGISRSFVYGACPVGCIFMIYYAFINITGKIGQIEKRKE